MVKQAYISCTPEANSSGMLNKSCNDIILYYKGELSYDIIGDLIASLKDKMKGHFERFGLYKRLLTLMIESLENIVRYNNSITATNLLKKYPPEIMICYQKGNYIIETANIINNSDMPVLEEKINMLKNMNPDEIKELYKVTITDGKFSDKGGAGLGIIEMAKVADDKIESEFSAVDDNFFYFILRLIIKQSSLNSK